jgi:hypothetical protein
MSGSTNQQVRKNATSHFRALRWIVIVDASGSSTYSTEDTFVLLDALEADADAIRDLAPRICLEIGRVRVSPTTSHCSRRRSDALPTEEWGKRRVR